MGESSAGEATRANVDGRLVGAVEVGRDWGLIGQRKVCLTFRNDLALVLICGVDYGLRYSQQTILPNCQIYRSSTYLEAGSKGIGWNIAPMSFRLASLLLLDVLLGQVCGL